MKKRLRVRPPYTPIKPPPRAELIRREFRADLKRQEEFVRTAEQIRRNLDAALPCLRNLLADRSFLVLTTMHGITTIPARLVALLEAESSHEVP